MQLCQDVALLFLNTFLDTIIIYRQYANKWKK